MDFQADIRESNKERPPMRVAQAIAEILKKEGVEFVFAYPVNPVIEACARLDIRTVVIRQERVGLHMADAVSRLSSGTKIGVFVMQHGPGAENGFGGVALAYSESVPILIIVGGYARSLTHHFPNFNSTLNFKHVTKHVEPLLDQNQTVSVLRRCFSRLRQGPAGPVMLELPMDISRMEIAAPENYFPIKKATYSPDAESIRRATELLSEAQSPVILAGQGVHYAAAWNELREYAEQTQIPVMTSLAGKSSFPEDHPLSLGSGGITFPETVSKFLADADVIFGIGCSFAETLYGVTIQSNKKIIHATLDPDQPNSDTFADVVLLGDAKLTLDAMSELLKGYALPFIQNPVSQDIQNIRSQWLNRWDQKLHSSEIPINPYRIIWELDQIVDKHEVIITHDAGSARDMLSPFWTSLQPLSYIGWGKSTQLGYGLGLAMGAKLLHPDKLCINVWGDAAIGFTGMDFETAVREELPILSILLNNSGMAVVERGMRQAQSKYGSTTITGHYADMATALGGYGRRVTDPEEIRDAIEQGIAATQRGRPTLLEFITSKETEYSTQ